MTPEFMARARRPPPGAGTDDYCDYTLPMLKRPLFWLSLPLLLPQGLWVRRTAQRLPPAAGPTQGVVGHGDMRRLLLVGDSIIAGVGVPQLTDALPGQLARAFATRKDCRVQWQALGNNGATSADLLAMLGQLESLSSADWVFVSVGVNDVTQLTGTQRWRSNLQALLLALARHSPQAQIMLAGVPPMGRFPGLPTPLRQVFGWRAARLDVVGQALAAALPRVLHLATPVPDDPSAFASDGYHPNAEACRVWAEAVAAAMGEQAD
jgi:lysophospholipase L1-like esterase